MKRKVEKLRTGLAAGVLVLLVAVGGTFFYSRYRAGKAWLQRARDRSGATLERETDGFTYSQSMKGRTVFSLHAAKAFQHDQGTYTLHDVVITVYGMKQDRADRVSGKLFEWDEKTGIARALGDVEMDLAVPQQAATAARASSALSANQTGSDPEAIHVHTSNVQFLRKLGVAATSDAIEIRYKGVVCTAVGAELDDSPNQVHLLANVLLRGTIGTKPVELRSAKADVDRDTQMVSFTAPDVRSTGETAKAQTAVLHLRRDGSVERAGASGDVVMARGTRTVSAARLDALLDAKSELQSAKLTGGVRLTDTDAARPSQGDASEADLRFGTRGRLENVTALGGAHLLARQASGPQMLERELKGDRVDASFSPVDHAQGQLREVHVAGNASMRGQAMQSAGKGPAKAAGLKETRVSGDDLRLTFVAQGAKDIRVDTLHGQGNTRLRETAPQGEEQVTTANSLDVTFAPGGTGQLQVASAVEQGAVTISSKSAVKPEARRKASGPLTGSADRAAYDGPTDKLILTGNAHMAQEGTSLTAASVAVNRTTGDAEADGGVAATLVNAGASQVTHVTARKAVMRREANVAEFSGDAARPARLWQEASQVEAAIIVLDRQNKTLVAKPAGAGGKVRSVFAETEASRAKRATKAPAAMPTILRVESNALEYSDGKREAVFAGPVHMEGSLGDVRAERAEMYFVAPAVAAAGADAALPTGQLDHAVASGNVRIEQTGRQGSGEQLVYKAADGSFVLTGTAATPPRVVDQQQGTVTGASLLFRNGDSTIVVAGGLPAEAKPQRTRIETHVRKKTTE